MIKNYLFSGDCHSIFDKFSTLDSKYLTNETAIIILGDIGINYFEDDRDIKARQRLLQYGDYIIYCVRGNHDINPKSLNYKLIWDYDVNGWVYIDPWSLRIKYFPMVSYYNINHYTIGVIGGSFSVDKQYRIANNMKWFSDEQLTEPQLKQMVEYMGNKYFDIILTHTCPISWQPTDLFLPQINQDLVDKTTETYLQKLADKDNWGNWLWGHFHDDRDYRDGRRHMIMDKFKTLEEIVEN